METAGTGASWIAAHCGAAISMCCWLMSRVGCEPVMRDPGSVLVADEFFPLLAQAREGGPHAVHLPARGLGQIAECGAVWPLEQSDDRRFLRRLGRRGRRAPLRSARQSHLSGRSLRFSRL